LGGLAQCLAQAIPFFRYTLAGDAVFATVFFGSYVVVFHAVQREVPVEDQAVYCN